MPGPALLDRSTMAEPARKTVTVRLDAELARKAGIIASCRQSSVPEYLKEVLDPIIEKHFKEAVLRLNEEAK